MTSSQQQIQKDHNLRSEAVEKIIQDSALRLAAIDYERAKLNEEVKEIKASLKVIGILPKAFTSQYLLLKKERTKKDEESMSEEICYLAISKMDQGDLFSFMDKKD